MVKSDLDTLSKISHVLWIDPHYSNNNAVQALSAVALMDLSAEQTLEKTCSALLEKARSRNIMTNGAEQVSRLSHGFYRLTSDERFILVALHIGGWSYSRLSRILGVTIDQVQDLAWSARIQMGVNPYPAGPRTIGVSCPEYDSRKPWTQRFLDEEMRSQGEIFFLQNHLLSCRECADTLKRCRDFYFKVEQVLNQLLESQSSLTSDRAPGEKLEQVLEAVLSQIPSYERPLSQKITSGTLKFLFRKDIALILLALGLLILMAKR